MNLPPNGDFDWPDYQAFETCPMCCVRTKPGSKDRHWLVFQPLMQLTESGPGIGVRMQSRLVCEDCFESMTDDKYLHVRTGPSTRMDVPLQDAIENQGPITWLQDGRARVSTVVEGTCMNAYDLYTMWEYTGAWQVLCDEFGAMLQEATERRGHVFDFRPQKIADPSTYWEMNQIPTKEGKICDGPNCSNVHGQRESPEQGRRKGIKIRLQECTGCLEALYCSEECQRAGWPEHKEKCRDVQKKQKEDDERKKVQDKMNEDARMEAALASFVPLSISPQTGGGAKKKKNKKAGWKRKKGKK